MRFAFFNRHDGAVISMAIAKTASIPRHSLRFENQLLSPNGGALRRLSAGATSAHHIRAYRSSCSEARWTVTFKCVPSANLEYDGYINGSQSTEPGPVWEGTLTIYPGMKKRQVQATINRVKVTSQPTFSEPADILFTATLASRSTTLQGELTYPGDADRQGEAHLKFDVEP